MHIADRLAEVSGSLTLAISARAAELRRQGVPVVDLSAGEPDFPTPPEVVAKATEFLAKGQIKYTPVAGIPELRDAIARQIEGETGQTFNRPNVTVTCGVKHGLYLALQALCDPGDEIVFASPYWLSYPEMARLADAVPVPVPTDAEDGFQLSPERLAAAITPRTRALILNSPSNPTGAVQRRETVEAAAELAMRHGFWIFSDEIYNRLVYGDAKATSPMSLGGEVAKRTIVFNGFSKTYSMTGWRIGYAVAGAELISAMECLQSHETANANTLAQVAALAALQSDGHAVEQNRLAFDRRRQLMMDGLRAIPGWQVVEPEGAFYHFPRVADCYGRRLPDGKVIAGSLDLAAALLDQAQVATVPGVVFGDDDHIRLSYATSEDQISAGLAQIAAFVARLD